MVKFILSAVFTVAWLIPRQEFAQDDKFPTQPFNLCNVIVVKTTDNSKTIHQKLKESFLRQGYQVLASDVRTMTGKAKVNQTLEVIITAVMMDSHQLCGKLRFHACG